MQQMSALLLTGLYVLDFNAMDNCAQENMKLGSCTMRTFVDVAIVHTYSIGSLFL